MRRFHGLLAAAAMLLITAGTSNAALLTNGSFEANGGVGHLAGGVTTLSGWTVGSSTDLSPYPYVFVADSTADDPGLPTLFSPPNLKFWGPNSGVNNGFSGSPDGGYFIASSAFYGVASLSQTISGLVVGHQYQLDLSWAVAQATDYSGAVSAYWAITFGSDTRNTTTNNVASKGFSGWTSDTQTFTATSASQVLSFLPAGAPPLGQMVLLDGVTLTDVTPPPSAVPEPGSIFLMATGLVGALVARKRFCRN